MKISIIGAGNMAHQLGKALLLSGHDIVEIYNRNYSRGKNLAIKLNAQSINQLDELNRDIHLIIIAVSDDAIGLISAALSKIDLRETLVVHTSGSVPSMALVDHKFYGVLYPFQSMTIGQEIDFKQVPVLVYSNTGKGTKTLIDLGDSISNQVHEVSDGQRGVIHVAGVFANNFTNHMIAISKEILEDKALSFDIVKPLITNTLQKILDMDPVDAQTGPAVRGDQEIICKHIAYLETQPDKKALYQLISKSIVDLRDSKDQKGYRI